jgi:hypothetical protein
LFTFPGESVNEDDIKYKKREKHLNDEKRTYYCPTAMDHDRNAFDESKSFNETISLMLYNECVHIHLQLNEFCKNKDSTYCSFDRFYELVAEALEYSNSGTPAFVAEALEYSNSGTPAFGKSSMVLKKVKQVKQDIIYLIRNCI